MCLFLSELRSNCSRVASKPAQALRTLGAYFYWDQKYRGFLVSIVLLFLFSFLKTTVFFWVVVFSRCLLEKNEGKTNDKFRSLRTV